MLILMSILYSTKSSGSLINAQRIDFEAQQLVTVRQKVTLTDVFF